MRTRIFSLIFAILGLSLVSCIVSSAQVLPILSGELHDRVYSANQKAGKFAREIVQIDETFSEGIISRKVETLMRFVPAMGIYSGIRTVEAGRVGENERIFIEEGNVSYSREDKGPWRIEERIRRMECCGGLQPVSVCQHTVDIQKNLFETVCISKKDDKLTFQEVRVWIGPEGIPTVQERVEGTLSPRAETFRSTSRYEYRPSLRIDAPSN